MDEELNQPDSAKTPDGTSPEAPAPSDAPGPGFAPADETREERFARFEALVQEQMRLKAEWRKERAKLPFPEKIRILVEIQKRQAPILEARGKKPFIWKID